MEPTPPSGRAARNTAKKKKRRSKEEEKGRKRENRGWVGLRNGLLDRGTSKEAEPWSVKEKRLLQLRD